jgi:hypothetical protein
MQLTQGIRQEPQRIVLYGPEGIGKSTLASELPDPVFLDVEGSTSDLNVVRAPVPGSWRALVDAVAEFGRDHHGRKTLVIDTADWAEKLCIAHVCASNNMTSLGGEKDFGRSYNLLEQEWCKFLDSLSRIATSGMHVCLTAHAGVKNTRQPDVDAGYDRWELKMERKTAAATKEWARTVLFLNYKTYIVEDKGKKRGTGGHRVMYASHTPAWDAKNRAGLPDEMRMEYPEIARLFAPIAQTTATNPTPTPAPPSVSGAENTTTVAPSTAPSLQPVTPNLTPPPPLDNFLAPLFELMKRDGVSEREIQLAVAKRGYYPEDTPLTNYDPQFVAGKLVAYWPQVQGLVEQVRKDAVV